MAASRTVVIAGAGLGGLTAALALSAQGYRVLLIDKAQRLDEIGAGVQLSPNASRILIALGLGAALTSCAVAIEGVSLNSARAGGEIARLPLGDAAAFRAGAPYWVVHRADLQAALLARVADDPDITLRLGWQFEDVACHANGVTVGIRKDTERSQEPALALIGADGVWSSVRHRLFPPWQAQFSGKIAWRGTIDARQLPRELAGRRVQLWMGSDAHIVAYPIAAGRRVNIVVIREGMWNAPGWNAPGDAKAIRAWFADIGWPAPARMIVGAVDEWRRYALFTVPDHADWTADNVALLGDAAHAMLPFAAQGAAMAIEDAAVLAKCLGPYGAHLMPTDVAPALARYAGQRRIRLARMRRAARQAGAIYHLGGAMAFARDTAIRLLGPQRLLARQDWIYDWRVT